MGIDLYALLEAPDAVRIISGIGNRAKLLYALPESLHSKTFDDGAFELRSGTTTGRTTQDVLPPSIHPKTKEPYKWKGDWRKLPPFPPKLLEIWQGAVRPPKPPESVNSSAQDVSADLDELRDLVMKRDADCGYHDWIKVGMVFHKETKGSDNGFVLWCKWSGQSDKYPGPAAMQRHWNSFGQSQNPATIGYLRSTDVATVDDFEVLTAQDLNAGSTRERPTKKASPRSPRAVLVRLSEVEPEETTWLWKPCLGRGKLTMMSGDPGLGKSTVALDLASRISSGGLWPDDSQAPRGSVVILSAEDGIADVIRVRVQRQGGDASRIRVLKAIDCGEDGQRMFSLDGDMPYLKDAITELGDVSLLIIDPISAYCGNKDSYKDAEIRKLLMPLSALADELDVAILGIGHFTKDAKRQALYRGIGSIAFVAAARTAFAVARDPADSDARRCLLMPIKSNIGSKPSTFAFEIDDDGKLVWGEERLDVDPDSVLSGTGGSGKAEAPPFAEEFLRDLLKEGKVSALEIKRRAGEERISNHALRRAAKKLGVKPRKVGQPGAKDQGWMWSLPQDVKDEIVPDSLVPFDDPPRNQSDALQSSVAKPEALEL